MESRALSRDAGQTQSDGEAGALLLSDERDEPTGTEDERRMKSGKSTRLLQGTKTVIQQNRVVLSAGLDKTGQVKDRVEGFTSRLPTLLQCFLCFCCWTGAGLRELLSDETTIEFALGFIIGEAFGQLINALVSIFVMPLFYTILNPQSAEFVVKPGFFVLTNPNNASEEELASVDIAANTFGCQVLNHRELLSEIIIFTLSMVTVYWVVKFLRMLRRKDFDTDQNLDATLPVHEFGEEDSVVQEHKQCKYCLQSIPRQASRCHFCTSNVSDTPLPDDQTQLIQSLQTLSANVKALQEQLQQVQEAFIHKPMVDVQMYQKT